MLLGDGLPIELSGLRRTNEWFPEKELNLRLLRPFGPRRSTVSELPGIGCTSDWLPRHDSNVNLQLPGSFSLRTRSPDINIKGNGTERLEPAARSASAVRFENGPKQLHGDLLTGSSSPK